MAAPWTPQRARSAAAELARTCTSDTEFEQAAGSLLQRAIGFDLFCMTRIDAESRLPAHGTAAQVDAGLRACLPRLFRADYACEVSGQRQVQVVSAETGGDLRRCARWRDLTGPAGLGDELSVMLTADGLCWGYLVLYRSAGSSAFSADHAALAAQLAPLLGARMRASLREAAPLPDDQDPPGLVLFDSALTPLASTAPAGRHLSNMGLAAEAGLPPFVYAVAARAADTGRVAKTRALSANGRWKVLHAAPLTPAGPDKPAIAVTIQSPDDGELFGLFAAAWRLSPRERQVAALIADGRSTRQAAAELFVSENTVRQHVKSIFAKTAVHSREELRVALGGRRQPLRDGENNPLRGMHRRRHPRLCSCACAQIASSARTASSSP